MENKMANFNDKMEVRIKSKIIIKNWCSADQYITI